MGTKQVYTVAEVAERLKVHHLTVRRWLKAGQLKYMRLGEGEGPGRREIRISEQAVVAFMKKQGK
jgi:excisionase family DNA binding protein